MAISVPSRIGPRPQWVLKDPNTGLEIRFNRHINRKNNRIIAEMYECYKDGMSLAKIAKLYGKTRQAVYDVFHTRGYPLRSKKLKGARLVDGVRYVPDPQGYLRGTKDRKRVYLHKLVYQEKNGEVPKGHQIFFKDGNRQNCSIENLGVMPIGRVHLLKR